MSRIGTSCKGTQEMSDHASKSDDSTPPSVLDPQNEKSSARGKLTLLAALFVVVGVTYFLFRDYFTLSEVVTREHQLRQYQIEHPWLVVGVAVALYVITTGLSLPGATALTLVYSWYFGFGPALVIVSFSSTAGATTAFAISRYFLGDVIRSRFADRLATIDQAFAREGAYYLFSLRLIPAVPFFVVNAVMGLTTIRTWTFGWVSQLGMLPGTAAYVYAGSRVPDLRTLADKGVGSVFTWQLVLALVLLGTLPFGLKKAMQLAFSVR